MVSLGFLDCRVSSHRRDASLHFLSRRIRIAIHRSLSSPIMGLVPSAALFMVRPTSSAVQSSLFNSNVSSRSLLRSTSLFFDQHCRMVGIAENTPSVPYRCPFGLRYTTGQWRHFTRSSPHLPPPPRRLISRRHPPD